MTEQPVETEQQFLGNEDSQTIAVTTVVELPVTPALAEARQHYVPNAHLRRPSWSPVDDVEASALIRKSINANKLLTIAKTESAKAEDALSMALEVEDKAAATAQEALNALAEFTRKAAQEALNALAEFTRKDTGL